MDDRRFDAVTRSLGRTTSRRQVMRGTLALLGAAVGLRALDADAARRGYSGPSSDPNNGGASISIQAEPTSQTGVCRIAAWVAGTAPGESVVIGIVGDRPGGPTIQENFRVSANANGQALAVTKGTFDGMVTCQANAWFGSTAVYGYPVNLRCY